MQGRLTSISLVFVIVIFSEAVTGLAQDDPNRPVATTAALTPGEAAAQMKVPSGFAVSLVAGEPDIVQPIAYTTDDRGRLWIMENTNYPDCPGQPKDRLLVLESTQNDGNYDKTTVFWDKATFTSGLAPGHGGVWLGSPPHLLFIPDRNGDLIPDSEPLKLLDGWGNQDTHETLNDFIWGPDGWLYGTQGIYCQSRVGIPGTPDEKRVPINGGIWRYHPIKKIFELWAEGEIPRFEVKQDGNTYIKGRSDFADHPVYQTKWLKYGLRALGLPDPYTIPKVADGYSALFWMDYKDTYVRGKDNDDRGPYPYLGWACDHFHGVRKSPLGNRDYPLTWEQNASEADYAPLEIIDPVYVAKKLSAPHTWHAAEAFLYLLGL